MAATTQNKESMQIHQNSTMETSMPCYLQGFKEEVVDEEISSIKLDLNHPEELHTLLTEGSDLALLQAAWALVLRIYTGQNDVCFGYQEGQDTKTTEQMRCIRVLLDEKQSFMDTTEQLGSNSHSADEYTGDFGSKMAFNTSLFVLRKSGPNTGAEETRRWVHSAQIQLAVEAQISDHELSIFLVWHGSKDSEQVLNIGSTFDKILCQSVKLPNTPITDLQYISDRNKEKLRNWNNGHLEKVESCIHDVIHERALAQPNREALCSTDETLSYHELDLFSTHLAGYLIALGVRSGDFVPLLFDKSIWNVVAMLSVLKAGAAFVPLDPLVPVTRLQILASNVEASIVLCSQEHAIALSSVAKAIVPIDGPTIRHLPVQEEDRLPKVSSDDLAYLIWTSGSTGEPKGTMIEHGSYCSGVKFHGPAMLMRPESRVLQFAAHTFDASLVEILTTLMIGGVVCIPTEEERLNSITSVIKNLQVNWAVLTPSFVGLIDPAEVPGLKTLVMAGEAMNQNHVDKWSHINLVNGYGPSEASVAAVVQSHVTPETSPMNIGYPTGVHLWVTDPDDHHRLVPVGCVGELLIQGPTVARGYLKQPEKTSKSFIPAPNFIHEMNGKKHWRVYKTGDLVRQNLDGSYSFVGRKDNQVKVHGQRVELGEIEHHLNADPSVKYGLVLLPKAGPFKNRLVSVVALSDVTSDSTILQLVTDHVDSSDDIRERLSSLLPAYMVPSLALIVERLPFLPSGKLDRKRIMQWAESIDDDLYRSIVSTTNDVESDESQSAKPGTELENKLRLVWSHVLNLQVDQVDFNRSFMSLGGDSISAIQVKGHCSKMKISLAVQDILRSKSIIQLAQTAKALVSPSFHEETIEENFDLSPIQQLYFQLPNQGHGHFNQSFFLRVSHHIDKQSLRSAIEVIIMRHSMLRARFSCQEDGKWKQRITKDVPGSYRLKTFKISGPEHARSAIADSQTCLDATLGPVFAADLFQTENDSQLLFLVGHHLVIDLVSWRVILEDLEDLLTGLPDASTEKPASFQSWCQSQYEHAQKLAINKVLPVDHVPTVDVAYWGMLETPNTYGNVECKGFEVDQNTTNMMLTQCHDALRTDPVDILLSSLAHSFALAFPDRSGPTIFNEAHGREASDMPIDISRTVGWFTVMYPVHVQESASKDLLDTVRHVKDFRRRLADNGRPYFAARSLTIEGKNRFSHHWPLEITFNYLGQYQQLERQGALLTPVDAMAGETRGAGGIADVGLETPRFGLFEISAVIAQGKLRFSFTFNRAMKHQDRILKWISCCQETIISMVETLTHMNAEVTPSDFPLLSLTFGDLQTTIPERLQPVGVSSIEDVEDIYPCSSMQEGLLISQSKSSAYYAVRVISELISTGDVPVDGNRLSQAWQQVVDRHAALRTIFIQSVSTEHGLYDQVVLKRHDADITYMDCSSGSYAIRKLSSQVNAMPDLRPPHKFTICQTSDRKLIWKLEISHTIMDGASMSIIFRDLAKAYEGLLATEPKPLYSDYISFLQNQPAEASLEYWKTYLAEVEPCTFPVLNDGLSAVKELKSLRLEFGDTDHLRLQKFCNDNGWTLSNVLHMAWGLTLRSYTSSKDVCFGYLISGRDSAVEGIEDAVGPFINMLVCRISMVPKNRLGALLDQLQKDYLDSLPNSTTSLAEVQHALHLSGDPLFNTALSFRRLPQEQNAGESKISFKECVPIYDPTEYSISINAEASEKDILIDLDYWTDHISPGQASNVGSAFLQALSEIMDQSDRMIEDLSIFSPDHHNQVRSWNDDMPDRLDDCVHNVIYGQACSHPGAQAICAWDAKITYTELEEYSSRIAQYLVGLNVGPEVFVPVCFDKSAWTIVAMLGILKAGGAAVPLDATHPRSALELRVKDTGARVVLAAPDRAHMFEDMGVSVVCVSSENVNQLPAASIKNTGVTPDNPCFIIYTSGSTGKPKGVVLEHRAIVTSAHATASVYGFGPNSRVLQFAAYTFDNSLAEMFFTLMRGGCVCVPSEHDRLNDLAGAINKLDVNFVDITPTVAGFLRPADVPKLKGLSLGGEALTREVIEIWADAVSLHCCYGPSECSVNSTWNGSLKSSEATNVGKSIGSVSWIVDPDNHDHLVPLGGVGELLIEGPILSRGYLNDPEKTAKAFITNPKWAVGESRRMYKTGDLARYNSDGTITYLGRKDTQIKLNGQRIELGEIEHHLKSSLPSDSQSAVELISLKSNSKKTTKALAAFFCVQGDGSVPVAGLNDFLLPMSEATRTLSSKLETCIANLVPSYMVPTVYIPVKAMPTTSSGKLDRQKLRSACESLPDHQSSMYRLATKSGRPPSSSMEMLLAELWETILGLEPNTVGLDDNFFRLGGDSVAAIKLISASRNKGIPLTVSNVFRRPILFDLAMDLALLSVVEASYTDQAAVEPFSLIRNNYPVKSLINEVASHCRVDVGSIQDIYPCTAIQEGLIALSNKDPGAYVAQNIYGLPSDVDISRFKNAWETVVEAEVILRTRVVFTESCGFLQVVVREPISWKSLNHLQDIVGQDRSLPAYNGGELSMYSIVEELGSQPLFVWTAHHALYDGWCIPLMLQRVEGCYRDLSSIDKVIGTSYPRFIRYLSEIDTTASEAFWRAKLSGTTAAQFPALPHPSYQVHATSISTQTINVRRAAATHITLPSTIRAAWTLAVSIYSGSDDVVFGETLTGRDVPVSDVTDIIGPTLATVPTRIHIDPKITLGQFLEEVQHQSAETIPFQHTGIQHIKHLSQDTAKACGFQNLLAIHHDSAELGDDFWDLRSSGTVGTNFYSYPLTVSCQINDGKVEVEAHYDQQVIPTWLVEKILIQFEFILEHFNLPEMMEEKLGEMRLLNATDESSIQGWNSSSLPIVRDCIHHIIQNTALEQPDAKTAVEAWDETFTYRELVSLSSQLAGHLLEMGAKDTLIPLCFDKSAWTIVAMLGVLMSGAALVPLDPTTPVSRLKDIVADTNAQIILCSPRHEELCTKLLPGTISVDRKMMEELPSRVTDLPKVDSIAPAYVIFTSGTTGKPKGTIVQHTAFCSGAASHGPALLMDSSSRVLQFASYTFDASLLEILTTLTLGGCVCVPSEDARMNNITDVINNLNVSWTLLTPSFVQLIQPSAVPSLRTLVLGGEAMGQTHLSTWADKLELINAYGPSEASVVATASGRLSLSADPVNIGRAVGSHSWVADIANPGRLVPIGAQGELIIEGPILSQGYLNNEERTADVFINSQNWGLPTTASNESPRVYRTGDIVKYTSNGELIYCGRKDTQTKLHGQRLELSEVEHHLKTDPFVQHAIALVPKNGPCKKRLVAVLSLQELAATHSNSPDLKIVVKDASSFYLSGIRERLCDKLSASTMPSTWVILQSLPLLPSGKLDRRQIEQWVQEMDPETYHQIANVTGEKEITEGTVLEKRLQRILGQALNLPAGQIGLHQSFLHLGGDSLSAMQVMSKCRAEGLGISVQDIIQSKSISHLALRVSLPEEYKEEVEATDQYFGLSPMQQLYFECVGDTPNHFNQSVLLRLTQRRTSKDVAMAIQSIVNSHPILRARFAKNDAGIWQQSITNDTSYRYQARTMVAEEIPSLVQRSQQSLDIFNGPVLAVDLIDTKDQQFQTLSIVAHHLVVDVVSWRIILEDLEDILLSGKTTLQNTLSFQSWCRLQVEHAQNIMGAAAPLMDDVPVAALEYWGMDDKLNTYSDTVENGFELDPETSLLLLGNCHEAMRTETVDILLASLLQSFHTIFQGRSASPAIYNEGHGREPWKNSKVDLSRTVGWFTTMCPVFLPSQSAEEVDLLNTIRWVKDLRRQIPDKGRPYFAYRMLTEEGQQRFSSHWPMEMTFNYLGKMQQLERKDALLQPVDDINTTRFDSGGDVPRFALFEISAAVTNGAIKMSFSYNRQMKRQAKIGRWISECQKCLQDAAKRLVQMNPERTLAEFPLLPLAYNGISKLVELLPQLNVRSVEDIEDVYPCSSVQQGMLLAQLKNPQLYAYSSILEVSSLDGQQVNPHLLAESWQATVQRHSTLRTVFIDSICQKGLNDQVVLRDTTARISWLECEDSRVTETFEQQNPLNFIDFQPPHRMTLCKTSKNRVFCKLEISHAICDGTSIPILLRDFSLAYSQWQSRSPISNPLAKTHARNEPEELAIGPRFSEYISYIQSATPEVDINYWKAYLAGTEPCHLEPLDDGVKLEKKLRTLVLPLTKSSDLETFCSKNGFTMSNVLQLVWALVLREYVGTDEVVFGYLTSGRDAPILGIQDAAVGTFINMLTCRIHLDQATAVDEALRKVQTDFINGMAHQSCSLGDIQHELGLSSKPLFNTAFTFQKRIDERRGSISSVPIIGFTVLDAQDPNEYDVTINVEAMNRGVEVHLGYWNTCLSDAQAMNMAKTFEHALNGIISPHQSYQVIGDLDMFSDHSRQQVMLWNHALPATVDRCIHDIIQDQNVGQRKNAPAICAWDGNFTYKELNCLAAKLALHLIELGVGPETYVPLCFPKSAWAVISMIAVLKAGGAFVPLDYMQPDERLKNFILDVQADLVLCSHESSKKLSGASKHVLIVDMKLIRQLNYDPENSISPIVSPDNSAYIIFTSGTTGRPKGTIIEHAAFCTGAVEHGRAMGMTSESRVLQFASHTFDASVMEILTTLIVGGCICIPSEQDRMNDIPGVIKAMRVTWTLLTPSVTNTISPKSVPNLKVLVTGGEKMAPGHIAKWKGHCCLINAYGPSETSVIASVGWKVDKDGNEVNSDPSNIGRAVGGRSWVVDPNDYKKLVAVGGLGELVIEGRTVARGYLNNDQKTSESFISNPTWLHNFDAKQRVYRTGDLVRYNSDGTLSFVSRKDTQIKLNGQRIELGEIEHNVKVMLPDNFQSAVELVAPMSRVATKALAVFFSHPGNDQDSTHEDTRVSGVDEILLSMSDASRRAAKKLDSSLASVLPTYMIPTFYVPVTKMPWTSSGKLDRARLRNILQALPMELTEQYRPGASETKTMTVPASAMEKRLQKLWENVLNISPDQPIGTEDSFFRLGGDSVTAMKLVGLARSEAISLTVMEIFKNPRLCDMALVCTTLIEKEEFEMEPFSLLDPNDNLDDTIDELVQQCRVENELVIDAYPCSLLQEGLVTLSTKQSGAYVIRNIFKLPINLDINRFKQVWEETVEDLDILRTRIVHMRSSKFVQVVLQDDPIEWNVAKRLEDIPNDSIQIPAHNGGRLTRYSLATGGKSGEIYFVWQIHHALYDGWSLPMILSRVESAYYDESLVLPKSPYSLFIQYLSEVDQTASNDYWRTALAGAAPLSFPQHNLAPDQPKTSQTLQHTCHISRNTASMGTTVATIIRAAWAILISVYSDSNDVVFGETMAGRNIPVEGITDIIGPTITTVPTRIRIDRGNTAAQFLQQVQKISTEVIPYQHVGLQRIKRLSVDAEIACDFQNLLVIQTAEEEIDSRLWDLQTAEVESNFFTYPLVLECKGFPDRVEINAHYDGNVLSPWQMKRILYQLSTILVQFSDLPRLGTNTKLSAVEVFSPQDRELVQKWNADIPRPIDSCIHEDFEDMALSQPQAPAVHGWDQKFSYKELRDHATCLASHLSSLGVGPEVFVPICMDKSAWAIVAIMGVLLAGGAYVPLDPSSPQARRQEMIKDVHARLVLCSPIYREKFKGLINCVLPVDQEQMFRLSRSSAAKQEIRRATSHNAAYIIFTSGSTGKPKGTVVEHRAISTSSVAMRKSLLMRPDSRVFQFASFTFDVSVLETLTTLTCGGCICIPSEDMRTRNVGEAIHSLNATWAFLTPSVANLIDPTTVPTLKVLVCGGEAMSTENVHQWASKVTLVNGYGPTEASVIAISNARVSEQRDPSNIGYALSSGNAWIADAQDHNLIAPIGCIGELLLSGPLLAREYINNSFKTEEAFIDWPAWANSFHPRSSNTTDDHFSSISPDRIYKTGDLVRYNEDGSLTFIGRKDNQVKLHGQRMELGEIEHLLDKDSQVQNALVSLPKSGPFRKRLVAVVSLTALATAEITKSACKLVLDGPQAESRRMQIQSVRNKLSDSLPPYMIPSSWLVVESVPLLASGKLDRRYVETWLQGIDDATYEKILEADEESEEATPATETSRILQQIISRVLNLPVERVQLSKSFLSLGGDSITSMQVMAHCRKEKINFSLTDVLKSKSIHQLASIARHDDQVELQEEVQDKDFDLSPIQNLYFQSQAADTFQGAARFNQSFSLEVTRRIQPDDLKAAIQKIVQQHSMLRARFRKTSSGLWQQRVVPEYEFDNYRLHHVEVETEIPALVKNSQSSMDIQKGPLFIVDLFDIAEDRQMVYLVAHHLVIDMVSWRIIIQDLEEILNTGSLTSEKPLSFQVWCSLQQDHSQKMAADESRIVLPFNVPPPNIAYWGLDKLENTYRDVVCESFTIDEDVTTLAFGDCNKALGTEPIELFLAAIMHSFRRVFLDREVPAVFNETHGREPWDASLDISRTVGWFTSMFPVHVPVDLDEDDVVETVRRMKDTRRSVPGNGRPSFAHRFLTSEGKSKVRDHQGLMEILFNYLGRMQQLESDDALLQQWNYPDDEETTMAISDVGSEATRLALFEVSAAVIREKVQFTFLYNSRTRHRETIQRWISECRDTFEEIVERLAGIKTGPSYTLSDFPLLPLTYDGLNKILTKSLPQVGITQDNIEDIYPCAPLQEGLLISQLKSAGLYHVHAVFEVSPEQNGPPLDSKRLARAWQKVVDRHAALRTVFVDSVSKGDIFNQVVVKKADSGVVMLCCEESEALDKLNSMSILDANYKKLPRVPHQVFICETPEGKVYMKAEVNHAIIDGTSANIMLRDLTAAYHGKLPEGPGPLFSDYIAYVKRHGAVVGINFWKKYLEGASICNFPVQVKNPPKERRLTALNMKYERFPALQEMCGKMNVTMANVMSAAWAFCLREYTKSDDVAFGYLTSGRDVPVAGVQSALGSFINILVCRVRFSKRVTLKEVFQKVQNDYLQSLEHQHCSLAQVQHDLMSGQALFNTAVSIQSDGPSDGKENESISFNPVVAYDPSEYPVTLNIRTARNDEGVVMRYWTDIMSQEQAEELLSILGRVMDNFINKPHQLAEDLDLTRRPKVTRPQATRSRTAPGHPFETQSQLAMSETQLRKIVTDCVREVIEQMATAGAFANYGQRMNDSANIIGAVEQTTVQSMIDYSQLTPAPPPPRPRPTRTSSTAAIASTRRLGVVEQKLLSVWSELLQISKDSIKEDDSFFKLGGDSIVAMQMVGMARDEDLALTVANIFRHPTFADMAAVISMGEEAQSPEVQIPEAQDYIDAHESRAQAIQNALYQRYSLLEAHDVDAFLQQNICPRVRSFRGGIIDVFPVTDFQALAVTGALMEAKWMLNYFYLEGDGFLDLKTLKSAISRTVNAFDILRTVFTPYGNRFFQVVLRKLQPLFSVHETDNLENFTTELQQKDRQQGPRLGESYLQFTVAHQKNSSRHRIIMRISHAQYDGVCLPSILSALQSGYDGHSIPETPAFSTYVRDAARQTTDEHYLYWKRVLKGSSMTNVVHRRGPNYSRGSEAPTTLKRVVRMPSLASEGITPATVIKAAWSLVLAQWSAKSDIVFGNVISGRNAAVLGVDRIIGPCVNLIPVRVSFHNGWTVLDLLRSIQDQQVAAMPYESLGFREIIKHCTSWPDWTNFSTVCQHQNIQRQSDIRLGDNDYTLGAVGSQEEFADLTVLSTPQDGDNIEISLTFTANSGITLPFAKAMFQLLCEISIEFPTDLTATIPSPTELTAMPQRTLEEVVVPARPDLSLDEGGLSNEEVMSYSVTLNRVWRQILTEKNGQSGSISLEASFFELGGDIVGLAQVGSLLEQEGIKLRIEDLVDHPKMIEQLGLMALERRKERESMGTETPAERVQEVAERPKKGLKSFLQKSVKLAKKVKK